MLISVHTTYLSIFLSWSVSRITTCQTCQAQIGLNSICAGVSGASLFTSLGVTWLLCLILPMCNHKHVSKDEVYLISTNTPFLYHFSMRLSYTIQTFRSLDIDIKRIEQGNKRLIECAGVELILDIDQYQYDIPEKHKKVQTNGSQSHCFHDNLRNSCVILPSTCCVSNIYYCCYFCFLR